MSPTTLTGRVRPTVRMKPEAIGEAPRVVSSSWASDRAFPRTQGSGVAFELETSEGTVYRIEPFEALVTLPVRATTVDGDVRREEAWIALDDEITVEGELERGKRAHAPAALRAHRIVVNGATSAHRLPPRTLKRGEAERSEKPPGEKPNKKKRPPDPAGTPPPPPESPESEPGE